MYELSFTGKTPNILVNNVSVVNNSNADIIRMTVQAEQQSISLTGYNCYIKFQSKSGFYFNKIKLDTTEVDDNIVVDWLLSFDYTQYKQLQCQLQFQSDSSDDVIWQSEIFYLNLSSTIDVDRRISSKYPTILQQLEADVHSYDEQIANKADTTYVKNNFVKDLTITPASTYTDIYGTIGMFKRAIVHFEQQSMSIPTGSYVVETYPYGFYMWNDKGTYFFTYKSSAPLSEWSYSYTSLAEDAKQIAEGRCNTFVASCNDTIASIKEDLSSTSKPPRKFMAWNSNTKAFEDKTAALLNGDYDSVTLTNASLNSDVSTIGLSSSIVFRSISGAGRYPIIAINGYWYIPEIITYANNDCMHVGDLVLILEDAVPNRWVYLAGTPVVCARLDTITGTKLYRHLLETHTGSTIILYITSTRKTPYTESGIALLNAIADSRGYFDASQPYVGLRYYGTIMLRAIVIDGAAEITYKEFDSANYTDTVTEL